MRGYEMSKSSDFEDLNLPVSSLYLLAAPPAIASPSERLPADVRPASINSDAALHASGRHGHKSHAPFRRAALRLTMTQSLHNRYDAEA
jgi:hypothetical protein